MWARPWEWIKDLRQKRMPSSQADNMNKITESWWSSTLSVWLKNRMPKTKTRRLKTRNLGNKKPKTEIMRTKSLGPRMLGPRMVRI